MADEQKTPSARSAEKANPRGELLTRKVSKIIAKESPSGAESIRTKHLWPVLKQGMTIQEWHEATKENGGVATIYIVELVLRGHIEVDPPLNMPA